MRVFEKETALKSHLEELRAKDPHLIGFVPTMGALHRGHLSLIERAREKGCVACSIFVNPLQFNDSDDYRRYPRDRESDLRFLRQAGCDVVFVPTEEEMYPPGTDHEAPLKFFDPGTLYDVMEGKYRPGHFHGVAVAVRRLFEIFRPDAAYFGEKDYQQLLLVKRMADELLLPVNVIACPTVREADGLAMSSRNLLLTPEQRRSAPLIYETLCRVKEDAAAMTVKEALEMVQRVFRGHPHLSLQYFEIADANTLQPVSKWRDAARVVACMALHAGKVRLIDNILFTP